MKKAIKNDLNGINENLRILLSNKGFNSLDQIQPKYSQNKKPNFDELFNFQNENIFLLFLIISIVHPISRMHIKLSF